MNHEVMVNGEVRAIKYGETSIGGIVQRIKYGETKVGGVSHRIEFGSEVDEVKSFADTPWSEIAAACEASYNGDAPLPTNWKVGDTHKLKIYASRRAAEAGDGNLNYSEYDVVIIGIHHDDGEDSACPLTLQLKECLDLDPMYDGDEEIDNYFVSNIHLDYLPDYFWRIDPDVRQYIRAANKWANSHEGIEPYSQYCELFLLDDVEVFNLDDTTSTGAPNSTQYEYYADGKPKVKNYLGEPCAWWLRNAADNVDSEHYSCVLEDGTPSAKKKSAFLGISFAFCL